MVLYQLFANGGMLSPGGKRRHLVNKKFMLGDLCRQMLHQKFYAHSRLTLGVDSGPPTLSRQGLILIVLCLVFHLSSAAAVQVIKETACDLEVSGECEAIFGPDVVCGNGGYCKCLLSDDVPVGDQCRNKCATEARKLHDMDRRIKNYKNVIGEPPVTDYEITEGWYSLDEYRMMVEGIGNLTGGSCGTRYQIVIKEGATIDWDTLDLTEVILTATVYGRPIGHGEDLDIRVRKCEDAFQYYLKPPSIRLAAYCFDSMKAEELTDEEDPLIFPDGAWVYIDNSLHFREELRQGVWFDVPYVVWTCQIVLSIRTTEDSMAEELFVSVSWFVENSRVQSTKPHPIANDTHDKHRRVWASAYLTEDDLLDAGHSLGAVIMCGAQVSRGATGKLSNMFSGRYSTNIFTYTSEVSAKDEPDHFILKVSNYVPLGCAAPVSSEEQTCSLKLHITNADGALVCSESPANEDQHEVCGVTIFGRTKNGTLPSRNYTNGNGTSIKENEGAYVLWKSSEGAEGNMSAYVSLAVTNNTAGHALWNNYHIHNVKIVPPESEDWYPVINVYENTKPIVHGWSGPNGERQVSLTIEEAGNYILIRNGGIPLTVEIEFEQTVEYGDLSFCGVYLRYGNDIYANSFCGGAFTSGLIFGDGYHIPNTDDLDQQISEIYISVYQNRGQLSAYIHGNKLQSKSMEGLVYLVKDKMMGRDGHIYTEDPKKFLQSWRITDAESLLNPDNHIHYSWMSNYSSCSCPSITDTIPERVATSISDDLIDYNVYTGALSCNLDEFCTNEPLGTEWPGSLIPDYLIAEVNIGCEQRTDWEGKPLLWFTCQFHAVSDKLYTVEWFIDGVIFRRLNAVKPATDIFGLTEDEMEMNFALDVKIQCSVNVLDNDRNVLIGPVLSQILQPIHFTSTEIVLQRGRDGYITWTNYIPFRCNDGYVECEMELQFYDPNDTYDCSDSTIAFKPGSNVKATSTVSASTGNEITTTITTKNNDKYELKSEFDLRIIIIFRGAGKSTWTQLLKTTFLVTVVTEPFWIGMDCHLHVDPHAKTADSKYYEMQYIGMFVLAKHLILPIQIQVVTMSCWEPGGSWPAPTCACALIFQAGRDIFLIDRCEGARFNGFLLHDDDILDVYERSDTRYQIIFPDLMMADVYVFPYMDFMNVDIYPSPNEMHYLVGLCGNFNGDTSDDFRLRDTGNQGSIEGFSLSWELINTGRWESDSLLEAKNYLDATPWSHDEILCVYPNANDTGYRESSPLCSANEEQTCTKSKSHNGKKLNHTRRPRRETGDNVDMDIQRRVQRLKRNVFKQHAIQREKRDDIENTYRMNETDARRLCIKYIANSTIYKIADRPISAEPYIEDCVLDLMASGDEEWAKPHITALTIRNEIALEKDVVYAQSNSQVVEAMKQICTHDCNGHGVCIGNDQCICEPGWGRKSCLIEVAVPPTITYITGYGTCDTSTETCVDFIIETDGVLELFYAKVVSLEAHRNGTFVIIDEFFIEVPALSLNEGLIDIAHGRRRRTAASNSVFARQYGVSISNNGINYGTVTYVTVLDARCQKTSTDNNGDTIVILSAGYCFIDEACYSEGNSSEANTCKICRTATNLFDWTDENCPETSPSISAHDNVRLYAITFSVLGVVLVIIITSVALWRRHIKKKRPVTPLPATVPYRGQTPLDPIDLGIPEAILKEITGSAPRAGERMPSMHKN